MSDGVRIPCQWIEVSSDSRLVTAMVTVSPSRQRKIGPGTQPFTALAVEGFPVKLTGVSAMIRWKPSPPRYACAL